MNGFYVGLAMFALLAGCTAGRAQQAAYAGGTQVRLTEADRTLAEAAPEVRLNAATEGSDVCRMQLVTGTRIPRLRCEVMLPSEAALVEMQTADELEYAREQHMLDEAMRLEASLGHNRSIW